MSNQFKLLETNAHIELKNGIYQDAGEIFRDSSLSNYIQIAVADVFENVSDKSLFSIEIEEQLKTPELVAALSSSPFRFLQAFDLSKVHTVLDLSEDFGGVAHFLADQVNVVESVKLDPDLARLASNRCANNPNVCHISEDLERLTLPNSHYDLIVIGKLESFSLNQVEQAALFKRLSAALSPNGVLVVNALNSDRLRKWVDAGSSTGQGGGLLFADLYQPKQENYFTLEQSRKQLRDTLLAADFSSIDVHANFSTGSDCKALFSEDYLTASVNGLNHFYRLGSIENPQINEYLLYKKLIADKNNLVDFANRFLVVAGASSEHLRQLYDNDFTHFPGVGRRPEWRTITSRARSDTQVNKTAVYSQRNPNSDLVSQNLEPQPFYKGRILIDDWLQSILDQDHTKFTQLVVEYYDWLTELSSKPDFQKIAYDLLPFNIVLNERAGREFLVIDPEWQVNEPLKADFILFRALFWFAFENKPLLSAYADTNDLFTIGMFVVSHLPNTHQIDELDEFVILEERIQAEIDNSFRAKAVANALLQPFSSAGDWVEAPLQLEAVWGQASGEMAEQDKCSVHWEKSTDEQIISLSLPAFSSENPMLRIDPLASTGAFEINAIQIKGAEQSDLLFSIDSQAEIANLASLNGIKLSGIKGETYFIALNDDPSLTLSLDHIENIETASELVVKLKWLWGPNHSAAIDTLSSAVTTQNTAIVAQSHRLDQYRADIAYQTQRIEDLLGHRKDLTAMIKKEERTQAKLRSEIKHLNARLHAQHARNDELHGYLLMRPSTRAKRVARRTLDRITGKPAEELTLPEPQVDEPQAQSALPLGELIGQNTEDYDLWVRENTLTDTQIIEAKEQIDAMSHKPVFSILVPIYNTDPEYLLPMIQSVQKQIYPHWQLCLVDDCSPKSYLKRILEHEALQDERISIQLNDINQGISVTTNDALAMASGDYIALLDHDDEISIDALYENAKVINANPDVGLIYSDEDKMDMQGNRLEPYFKPDYSPDLLHTNNYICHFTVIKKSIADEIGGFREGLDGSQDHDIILRAADASEHIEHIPKILYHWRKIPGSTAVVYDSKSYAWEAGRKAVEDVLKKREDGVRVEFGTLKGTYRVFREIHGNPLISIIIPFKDKPELLDSCLNSIINRTSYENFEVIGVSNNSEEPLTQERMAHFSQSDSRIKFVEKNVPFNFSQICNYGVEQASGEYVVLLNNDIEIISPDWIERMLEHSQRDSVGAVGSKLLYPDGRIQHAGVVAGMVGAAGHPHKFFPDNHTGYHGRLHMVYNVSAVTGAMMMVQTEKYRQVGGLDEDNLAVAYNDIDFCLKLLDAGYLNVFTPHAKATHHESISRGYEDTDEKMQRLLKEQAHFLSKWDEFLEVGDPYYNPNLSLKNERFSLKFKD